MKKNCFLLLLLFGLHFSFAQTRQSFTSTQIYNKIQKLNFLGSVLYVGAHPDDENTAMISYLSNKTHARVAYLAMTRGDGGQNIMGPEIRELLGVIRTEELLAARRIDGGQQFFTRANDFGYSKNPEETFRIWDKQKVLSDVVWVFRKFKPDVIIDRFDHRTEGDTHGHHTASARLAVKAFDLSGQSDKFSSQLNYVDPWQPKRLFMNQSWYFYGSKEKLHQAAKNSDWLKMDVGSFLPLRGKSNSEIAAHSRSQHKSQGFGVMGSRGTDENYLESIKGDFPPQLHSVFDGIDTSWKRVKGGKPIGKILKDVQENFDFKDPAASIPELLKAYQLIKKLDDGHWKTIKTQEIKEIIAACAGLYLQASTDEEFGTRGQKINVNIEAINRSSAAITLKKLNISSVAEADFTFDRTLANNDDFNKTESFEIPDDAAYTTPYWLRKPHGIGMYTVDQQQLIGLPESPQQFVVNFHLLVNGVPLTIARNLVFKTSTPTQGEVTEPFDIVPDVAVSMKDKSLIFAGDSPKSMVVEIKAYKNDVSGSLQLKHPAEWQVSPEKIEVHLDKKGKRKTYAFTVKPPKSKARASLKPVFSTGTKTFDQELHIIDYPHIRTQTVLLPAQTKLIRLDIKTKGENIAYIKGAGDDIPQSLRAIGYKVDVLSADDISVKKLQEYDAVVVGIRAYDTQESLVLNQNALFDYIKQGGTVVQQYNTTRELKTDKVAPYRLSLSHDRVTDENSKVRFLAPNHPVLTTPNKITSRDFENWVQERGLYFPSKWSDHYTPILGMHDQGEEELKGSLLVAKYGKGYFVYTGLSFFRELPAGVPGAFRLFANLLALGN